MTKNLMTEVRAEIWRQWDKQEKARIQTANWIVLNNLYLSIERGETRLTIHTANDLRTLVTRAYDRDDQQLDWWNGEFQKLPNWNNV